MRLKKNQYIRVDRKKKSELDMQINDLLKRGFVLIHRDESKIEKDFGERVETVYWARLQFVD
jgi:hypothetical protein